MSERLTLRQRAKAMRNNPTEAEKRLWQALRNSQLEGAKFRRQHVLGQCIFDFFCPRLMLAIEVDGETHEPEGDALRDEQIKREFGVTTLRFRNEDVTRNLDGVLLAISEVIRERG